MKLEVEHVEMVSTAQYIYENYICWLWLDEIPHNSRNSNDILAHGLCILLSKQKEFSNADPSGSDGQKKKKRKARSNKAKWLYRHQTILFFGSTNRSSLLFLEHRKTFRVTQ